MNYNTKRRCWTTEDECFLRDNRNTMNAEELADKLGRSVSSIYTKMGKMGIDKKTVFPDELSGKTIGMLNIVKELDKRSGGSRLWLCKCECGNFKEYRGTNIKRGKHTSCGCRKLDGSEWEHITKFKGKRFGKLTAIKRSGNRDGKNYKWLCKCDCGNYTEVSTGSLTRLETTSCGCGKELNLKGKRFGKLVVIERLEQKSGSSYKWLCECDCGETSTPSGASLNGGNTKSCGCLNFGVNSHFYNPKLTDEERLETNRYTLNGDKIYVWREKIYKRDGYACRLCAKLGVKINAHHLNGWNWSIEERFELENGLTLCENCHKKFHCLYGRGNNTKEQFIEYKRKLGKLS